MLGAIIGDIVGSRWEFNPTNDYCFPLFSNQNSFTDDTICTIAVADALLHNSEDFGKYIHDWCRKYPNPKGGYGGRFAQWVMSDNPQPYNSLGNGAAMRVSPIGHWYEDENSVMDAAAASAIVSHNHDEGIKGAQTVALAIWKAMSFNKYSYQNAPLHIDEIIEECVLFSGYDINMSKRSVLNKFDETCQGTVPVALKIISMSRSFEDAIRLAVSLGADADTLGAIVGSIAESIWGIPDRIRDRVRKYLPEDMLVVIKMFHLSRPGSYTPLIDTTFDVEDYSEGAWDLLDTKERNELKNAIQLEKVECRRLMAERAKARENW